MTIRLKPLVYTGTFILLIGTICLAYAYFVEPYRLIVNRQNVSPSNWPAHFDGLRIAAISDIHAGSNGIDEAKLKTIVEMTNALEPDLIVLLGDHIISRGDGSGRVRMQAETVAAHLAGLRAKHGVFAVLGNHDDAFSGEKVTTAFETAGIEILENEMRKVVVNGRTLRILGLPDHFHMVQWSKFALDARNALADSEGEGPVLVLEHSPDVAAAITGKDSISRDPMLLLAGHTHGGQIRIPVLGRPIVPSSYGQQHAAGHSQHNGLDIFVTTGIGTSILPLRFLVPPEIALVTIKAGQP